MSLEKDTVWLTQKQIAYLFGVHVPAISKHIQNVYQQKELNVKRTISKMETVQIEGNRRIKRKVDTFNLDVIISVGRELMIRPLSRLPCLSPQAIRNKKIR